MPLTLLVTRRSNLPYCVLLFWILLMPLCKASAAASDEMDLAVRQMLLGILSYVRWPEEPKVLSFCVLGAARHVDGLLQADDPHQANGRRIQVQQLAPGDPRLSDACNVVYLGALDAEERNRVFERLAGRPVLSIDEDNPDCSVGSMFCLTFESRPPSFAINLDSVARSGVRVHPNVLSLGRRRGRP